jgi:hypothetical protein
MKSVTVKNIENRTLAVAAVIYCTIMMTALGIGLYGIFSLFQFMFGSLEQTVVMHTWL